MGYEGDVAQTWVPVKSSRCFTEEWGAHRGIRESQLKQSDANFVIKYFDLVDEFIRVRCCSEEVLGNLLQGPLSNKATYRRSIVEACIPDYESDVLSAVARLDDDYDLEIVEELLYQICIDVNPSLEIHQVSIPSPEAQAGEGDLVPRPGNDFQRQQLYRKVLGLERDLKTTIVGQDSAVATLVKTVKKAAVGLKRPGTPIGTFLLVGRTGTGKTELAKALAKNLFDDPGRLVRVDCSEYALPHEYAKLIGSPPGYIGHNEGGYLTEAVRSKKNCVVLFDEVEKAHSKVHNLLLQLLDEGRLSDSKGQVIDFSQTIVILTSNLGIEKIETLRTRMGFSKAHARQSLHDIDLKEVTLEALREFFRPEFINRIDEVVLFNALDVKTCTRIASRMLREVGELLQGNGIELDFSSGVSAALSREGYSEEYGARELKRLIKRKIEDPVTELILDEGLTQGSRIQVRIRGGEPVIQIGPSATATAPCT